MSLATDKLRKHLDERKASLSIVILAGVPDPNNYHRLCGQYYELLSLERELHEIISDLQLAEDTEDE
jgi:hypothetical protein